jgi:hypothetical protein
MNDSPLNSGLTLPPLPATAKLRVWAALGLALLSAPALAATVTCPITPAYSIITEGQTLRLAAGCTGGVLTSIDWKMDGTSVTGVVPLTGYAAGNPIKYTTPVGLGAANETQEFVFSVVGVPAAGNTVTSASARVVVKPSSAVLALAKDGPTADTRKAPGACGSADGTAVSTMPKGTAQCAKGSEAALAITSPEAFTWSCLSLTGGAEASCYATRGGATAPTTPPPPPPVVASYTVATLAGVGGSISPATQVVTAGAKATVTASPASGYSVNSISGCGGTRSGNSFTTGSVIANCTVSASFTTALTPITGACGSASNLTPVATAPGANLCAAGSATSVAAGATAYTWGCTGSNGGGSTTACKAPRGYTVTTSAGSGGVISAGKLVAGGATAAFTVTPSAGYIATATGCGGALSGSIYTTGAITASCAVSATFVAQAAAPISMDPGTGLWVPPNTTGRLIADQSGPTVMYRSSYVPGCLNGAYIVSSWNTGCGANSSFTGTVSGTSTRTTFTFGAGRTLGLRYVSRATAGATLRYFTMGSADGGGTGSMSMWMSDSPTATYATTSASCKSTSTMQPFVATGPGWCPVVANKRYYLFMSTNRTEPGLRYVVNEGGADFD